jgi:hypothetical protein
MSNTPETDKEEIFFGYSPDEGDIFAPVEFARKLERQRDEAKETAERYRLEANAMMLQRDELVEAVREAWYIMDEVEGVDKLDAWQNKYVKYIEGTLI